MGRPADTAALAHCMSTSSLVLTIMNGRPLDTRAFLQKLSTMMASSGTPLSKDLLVTSLAVDSVCVSLSFSSRTTSEKRSQWANPTVTVIQHLGKKSIQTIRDNADVLRHIIKNVSSRLIFFSSQKGFFSRKRDGRERRNPQGHGRHYACTK
jgi:hypothetical protein